MSSIVSVDEIRGPGSSIDLSGNAISPSGHIVQVIQGTLGSTATFAATAGANANEYYDSGLSTSITPKSTSNKILVCYSMFLGFDTYQSKARIVRDSTAIGLGAAEGNRSRATSYRNQYLGNPSDTYGITLHHNKFLDSPNTTSLVTYKIQCAGYSGSAVYVNRSKLFQNGGAGDYDAIPLSTITLIEFGG